MNNDLIDSINKMNDSISNAEQMCGEALASRNIDYETVIKLSNTIESIRLAFDSVNDEVSNL